MHLYLGDRKRPTVSLELYKKIKSQNLQILVQMRNEHKSEQNQCIIKFMTDDRQNS